MSYVVSPKQRVLDGILVFENRVDFKHIVGNDAPAFDPFRPVQLWQDINPNRVPQTNNPYRGTIYNLLIREGPARNYVLESTSIPFKLAQVANLPPDQSSTPVDDMQFPIKDLLPGEEIRSNPFGVWIVNQQE